MDDKVSKILASIVCIFLILMGLILSPIGVINYFVFKYKAKKISKKYQAIIEKTQINYFIYENDPLGESGKTLDEDIVLSSDYPSFDNLFLNLSNRLKVVMDVNNYSMYFSTLDKAEEFESKLILQNIKTGEIEKIIKEEVLSRLHFIFEKEGDFFFYHDLYIINKKIYKYDKHCDDYKAVHFEFYHGRIHPVLKAIDG